MLLTEALGGEGVAELWDAIGEHRAHLESAGLLEERRRRNLAARQERNHGCSKLLSSRAAGT